MQGQTLQMQNQCARDSWESLAFVDGEEEGEESGDRVGVRNVVQPKETF